MWLALLTAALCGSGQALARLPAPPFELAGCAERATWIALGTLDAEGRLAVETVVKGAAAGRVVAIRLGAQIHAELRRAMGRAEGESIRVVAFFAKGESTVFGLSGVVGVAGESVYVRRYGERRGDPELAKHPTHTAESFLAATKAVVRRAAERRALIALPPSADRARKLVAFLWRHGRSFRDPSAAGDERSTWHVRTIAHGLSPLGADEERVFLEALARTENPAERVLILDLAAATKFSARAVDTLARFAGRGQPAAVRRSAFFALAKTDTCRAADHLAPLLTVDEPELGGVLSALSCGRPQDRRMNPAAVEGLVRLAGELRERHREGGRLVLRTVSGTTAGLLERFAHPRSIPILCEWATADDHVSAECAAFALRAITGLKFGRLQKDDWAAWWRKAKPVLTATYRLGTAAGRRAWCEAHSGSDDAAGRVLVRLWFFEKAMDEAALIALGTGKNARHAAAAKAALSTLWERGRLSAASRKALVAAFLNPRLVEVPGAPVGRHELQVTAEPAFAFPADAWVSGRCGWTVGNNVVTEGRHSWTRALGGASKLLLGSFGGGAKGGTTAICDLEVSEVDRGKGGKVVWAHFWTLGPIQLRDPR